MLMLKFKVRLSQSYFNSPRTLKYISEHDSFDQTSIIFPMLDKYFDHMEVYEKSDIAQCYDFV